MVKVDHGRAFSAGIKLHEANARAVRVEAGAAGVSEPCLGGFQDFVIDVGKSYKLAIFALGLDDPLHGGLVGSSLDIQPDRSAAGVGNDLGNEAACQVAVVGERQFNTKLAQDEPSRVVLFAD